MSNPGIYFYQYHKPRYTNPTYSSNQINSTFNFLRGNTNIYQNRESQYHNYHNNAQNNKNNQNNSEGGSFLPEINNLNDIKSLSQSKGSKLSNYGSHSLSIDQNTIHKNQNHNFNIISLKPNEYLNSPRQYPKFTVQNRDQVYYRKLNQLKQEQLLYRNNNIQQSNHNDSNKDVAGKHTYKLNNNKIQYNTENVQKYRPRHFRPKLLNHMDQLGHNLA